MPPWAWLWRTCGKRAGSVFTCLMLSIQFLLQGAAHVYILTFSMPCHPLTMYLSITSIWARRRFLNRLLGLPVARQNLLFAYFEACLHAETRAAKAEGRYFEVRYSHFSSLRTHLTCSLTRSGPAMRGLMSCNVTSRGCTFWVPMSQPLCPS